MIAKLIPLDGSSPVTISEDVMLIGRKRGVCDLYLDHGSISKLHCLIAKTDGLLFFRDLGSTNGIKVNGQRVTRGALLPGDELAFASLKFRVYLGPGEPEVGHNDRTEMLSGLTPPESDDDDSGEFAALDDMDPDNHSDSDVRLLPTDSSLV